MATVTSVALARTAAATSSTTLFTAAANTVITNIAVTNTSGSAQTFSITIDSVALHTTSAVAANSTVYIDLKQYVASGKVVAGLASATTVNFHISGVTIV